jgi:isoleucyl-tRNA synthetase
VLDLVAEELNVRRVELVEGVEELAATRAKPNFRLLGPRLGPNVREAARILAEDDGELAAALASGRSVRVAVGGTEVDIGPEEVELTRESREGWGLASEGAVTVALDLALTPELLAEGVARELVHAVQIARKQAGLEVTDRIELGIAAAGSVADAIRSFGDFISSEVLATSLELGDPGWDEGYRDRFELDGSQVEIALRKAK